MFKVLGGRYVIFYDRYCHCALPQIQGPSEPRERDYAYAGSFYAFAIWIGFGVAGIAKFWRIKSASNTSCSISFPFSLLPVPVLMAQQNWDDHDRSNRYVVRDFAQNYFNSQCSNAILLRMEIMIRSLYGTQEVGRCKCSDGQTCFVI